MSLKKSKKERIWQRSSYICSYCGLDMSKDRDLLSIDHVIPRQMGGTNITANLVTSCKPCNLAKARREVFHVYKQ